MMAQNRMGRPRMGSAGKSAGLPSHVMLIELKHRFLSALSKLADRDTQQIAMEELEKIVDSLSPEGISMCLSCLYDTDSQQKIIVRKECIKLFGAIATVHGDAVAPHLTKIISNIVKRLKDPDSNVREACQEAMGVLAAQYLCANATVGDNGGQIGPGSVVAVFAKPLFEAMNEQNKSVQTGAAACLARVVESAKDPPLVAFQRLCPRICKYLSNPTFMAKAALLSVIASLTQIGAISQQYLSMLMPCIHDCLDSSDWATRKAAADTLIRMATHASHAMMSCKSTTVLILEACRFDKVKPVRDSVAEALQLWKNMPVPDVDSNYMARKLSSSEYLDNETAEMSQNLKNLDLESTSPTGSEASSIDKDPMNNSYSLSDYFSNFQGAKIRAEKPVSILKKRASSLADKKLNPEFFQKLERKSSDDWQVEVAVPRGHPPVQSQHEEEIEDNNMTFQERPINIRMTSRGPNGARQSSSAAIREVENMDMLDIDRRAGDASNRNEITDKFLQDQFMDGAVPWNKQSKARIAESDDWRVLNQRDMSMAIQSWDAGATRTSSASSESCGDGQATGGKDNWSVIQKQLSHLEQQQASLMEMLKELMGTSRDGMLSLENRVRGLERVVEDMARDLAASSGRQGNSHVLGYEGPTNRSSGKLYGAPDHPSTLFGKGNDARPSFSERFTSSDIIQSGNRGGRESPWRSSSAGAEIWESHAHGTLRNDHLPEEQINSRRGMNDSSNEGRSSRQDGQMNSRRAMNDVSNEGRSSRQDSHDGEQFVNTRSWDRGAGPIRLGEGPSARSVWQASKDEATLEAIRVAGEDGGTSEVDALPEALPSRSSSRTTVPESNAEGTQYKSGGKGPFWTLWSRAMECLHSGDIDQAYVEVLCTGDELLLVRLMSRTGPVLDQLSTGTITDVLQSIGQLLQQQSFFDFGIPWIQQVANMIAESGPDCLGLSLDSKKQLLLCLQEASTMDLPEGWEGNTVDELFNQLANSWSIDLQQNESSN